MRVWLALFVAGCSGFSEVKADSGDAALSPLADLAGVDLSGTDLAVATPDLTSSDLTVIHAHARVFVSRNVVYGDMNASSGGAPGLLGADLLCLQYATAGRLGSSWRAWMSDSHTNAADRVLGSGPWYRTDDVMAFADAASLLRGPLVPLNLDQLGAAVPVHSAVWTATTGDGVADLNNTLAGGGDCNDWVASAADTYGIVGDADEISGGKWTDIDQHLCDNGARIYCFESP